MAKEITVDELAQRLDNDSSIAPIDVREPAEYNLAHIGGFSSLPRRLIEFRIEELVPYKGTPVILCDDDGRRAELAADTLESLGYRDVAVLKGGTNRWATEGKPTEWGMNVPSKDFGEKVLYFQEVLEIEPDELGSWMERGERFLLVDTRTPEEHSRFCIPGSRSLPTAEAALRAWDLIEDPETPVVVHCAGRTRSIIGAATLKRMGAQKVYALKNGTSGWRLSGRELEIGSTLTEMPSLSPQGREKAEYEARRVAIEDGVRFLHVDELQSVRDRAEHENVYLIDVRSREEYRDGHVPGFRWAPGGQLVQATDSYLGVRDCTIVLACDGVARAAMTASWLAQMGYPRVLVLDGGTTAWQAAGNALEAGMPAHEPAGLEAARKTTSFVAPVELEAAMIDDQPPYVLFVGSSDEYSAGHIHGSHWLSRSYLELRVGEIAGPGASVVVTSADEAPSVLAAAALTKLGYKASALAGGIAAWRHTGLPVETGLAGIATAPDDTLPFMRSFADMMNYLRWEEELGHKYEHMKAEQS